MRFEDGGSLLQGLIQRCRVKVRQVIARDTSVCWRTGYSQYYLVKFSLGGAYIVLFAMYADRTHT